jgi:hypothetical protein
MVEKILWFRSNRPTSCALEAAKKPYRFVLYPNDGHRLPVEDVRKKATAFLEETSGSACPAGA